MFDLLIKGGSVVDGTGVPARGADVAITDGKISAVEPHIDANAREIVDATGHLVAPGFVDIHTHYDGQVTWDEDLLPSTDHGVTTVVMGNCGVGFAPVRPGSEEFLISLMEGVEDIPGTALHEGIQWSWETFPQFLDTLSTRHYAADIAAQIPHGALRTYVMGERGADDVPASDDELDAMARHVREALDAGALGFSTSRIQFHQSTDGRPVPGTFATAPEMFAIGTAMRDADAGVFELVPSGMVGEVPGAPVDRFTIEEELAMMQRFAEETGRPVTFSFAQSHMATGFPGVLDLVEKMLDHGVPISPQVSARPASVLSGLQAYHVFQARPTYRALAHLPLAERAEQMRDPATRTAILTEADGPPTSKAVMDNFHLVLAGALANTFPLGNPADYEPLPSVSVTQRAADAGVDPFECLYDLMLEDDGRAILLLYTNNYLAGDLSLTEQLLRDDRVIVGLDDAGAHVRLICDASSPTFLMTHWARDRSRGPRLPVEQIVKKQSHDTAALFGLHDRGAIAPGKRADLNVIDWPHLRLEAPRMADDLPGDARRFLQNASGYALTVVGGVVTRRADQDTGARPGRLVRGARS
jgi:N-acyl-D-amino-acid deacylase